MGTDPGAFDVRQVTDRDADSLARLARNNPDSGAVGIAPQYATDPYDLYSTFCPDTTGFVAETPDGDISGMGFVSVHDLRVGGAVRTVAFLRGLVVKAQYRRRGLGTRLATERIDYAKRTHGRDCAIVASIQASNEPSRAVTAAWADTYAYDRTARALEPRTAPPPDAGYEVRHVRPSELPTVVERVNAFYADAELYRPYEASELREWLFGSSDDQSLRQYVVAHDGDEVVAGVDVVDIHKRRWLAVDDAGDRPPSVPESGEIRPRRIGNLWFADGTAAAARAVVETVRTDPGDANRIWFQSGGADAFAAAGVTDAADGMVEITTAVQGVDRPRTGRPVADLF
jgi:GNAT superfamily N-acetyltransferase